MCISWNYDDANKSNIVVQNGKTNDDKNDTALDNITSNAVTAERITRSYEKARYSDKNISKEELEFMLDFVKNDKYNKHT